MSSDSERRVEMMESRLQGFSLRDVCWGYRDIFAKAIEGLLEEGLLGPGREEASRHFFDLLKQADQSCFDHVLKEFVCSINPRTRWILDLPGVFAEVVTLGRELAEQRLHQGITFFRIWGEGGLGDSPAEVRSTVSRLLRLRELDADFAMAFLRGYGRLRQRLQAEEVDRYIEQGLRLYSRNRAQAISFMEGSSKSAENVIRSITRECRLEDVQVELETLLRALVGYEVEVNHLGQLDSDDLIARGTSMVCMYRWLYLPASIRHFEDAGKNRAWYLLGCVMAAGMLAENSFPQVHGYPEYRTCSDIVGDNPVRLNLFQIAEYIRVIGRIKEHWPGASSLIRLGIETEFQNRPAVTPAERLLYDCLVSDRAASPAVSAMMEIAGESINLFDTANLIDDRFADRLVRLLPDIGIQTLRPLSFLPDFLFPGEVSAPLQGQVVADLHSEASKKRERSAEQEDEHDGVRAVSAEDSKGNDESDEKDDASIEACFVYDEWSSVENDYHKDYCRVHEREARSDLCTGRPGNIEEDVRRVRQTFERLKPDLVWKEKRLSHGDEINPDRLVDFLVSKQKEPSPRIDFYERPLTRRRDLGVLVLLDVSGSTGGMEGDQKVIEIEKRTALIFAEGLSALGDQFAVCGFSGSGREKCEYYIYKNFDRAWNEQAMNALLSATPSSSTRIGAALRHSGYRLSLRENRQQLLILVTDGKPMDTGYDPNTRYAQYDVRKACEENERLGIKTFAISTEENTRSDMEIMFPHGRFVILQGMGQLPVILPRLYLKVTT